MSENRRGDFLTYTVQSTVGWFLSQVEMLLVRSDAAATKPPPKSKAPTLSEQIQSRALWRLRASLAETEAFSDVVRMEHFASSPEMPSAMTSFESNAMPVTSGDRRAGDDAVRAPVSQSDVTATSSAAAVSAGLAASSSSETRREAFRRAIAQRWTSARFDVDRPRRPQTSFDSMETDGDVSDTSCRPDMTTSFESTTTTTTTTDNTDDLDSGSAPTRIQHDSGYKSVEVHNFQPFKAYCCHMGTAIKHSVPDRVKPSFVIFDIRAL